MDLIDSLRWVFLSQYVYRLAVFRANKSRTKVITDRIELFLSAIFVTIVATEAGYTFHKAYYAPNTNFFQISKDGQGQQLFTLIGFLEFSFTILNALYFLYVALIKRRNQMSFIEKVQKIDDTLRYNFKMEIDYSMYKLSSLVVLVIILVYYNVVVASVMYFYLLDVSTISGCATFFVYIVQSAISGIFTFGFVSYVILIETRMAMVNQKLGELLQVPPEILEKQYKNKGVMCTDMMRYTKIYKNLCSCVAELNKIYGSSMVLHFAHDFTLLTTQIFAMFYIGFYEDPNESFSKIMALCVWLLPNFMKISLICFKCHMTTNEIEACGLYLRKFSHEANEDEINDFVDMFSLQSIHIKTEFSAANFFSIDMSLFFTIISACTTYLVILIQFKNYEDENDGAVPAGNGTIMANMTDN